MESLKMTDLFSVNGVYLSFRRLHPAKSFQKSCSNWLIVIVQTFRVTYPWVRFKLPMSMFEPERLKIICINHRLWKYFRRHALNNKTNLHQHKAACALMFLLCTRACVCVQITPRNSAPTAKERWFSSSPKKSEAEYSFSLGVLEIGMHSVPRLYLSMANSTVARPPKRLTATKQKNGIGSDAERV